MLEYEGFDWVTSELMRSAANVPERGYRDQHEEHSPKILIVYGAAPKKRWLAETKSHLSDDSITRSKVAAPPDTIDQPRGEMSSWC